jgi:hypothetical protein
MLKYVDLWDGIGSKDVIHFRYGNNGYCIWNMNTCNESACNPEICSDRDCAKKQIDRIKK